MPSKIFYSITPRCSGSLLEDLDFGRRVDLLPAFIDYTHNFHSLSLKKYSGFGPLDDLGNGKFNSWSEYLLNQTQFVSDLWPSGLFTQLQSFIQTNIALMPTSQHLIHGDYGFNNVFASGNKITGIIDWSDAKLGDFVYDIAYLSFWSKSLDYSKLFYHIYRTQNLLNLDNYLPRLQTYTIHLAVDLLNYFAKTSDSNSFSFILSKLDNFVAYYSLFPDSSHH